MHKLDSEFKRAKSLNKIDFDLINLIQKNIQCQFLNTQINWDDGAGDTWITFDCSNGNWAILNSRIPIIVATPDVSKIISMLNESIVIITEKDINARNYSINQNTILETLNTIWPTDLIDPNHFSIAELSWATN